MFPPSGGRGLTVLPSDRRLAGLNFGVQRFPVTVSEIVTEVTDEVVDGRLLGLCARAHLTAARALLEWLGRRAPGRLVRQPTPERRAGAVLGSRVEIDVKFESSHQTANATTNTQTPDSPNTQTHCRLVLLS